MESFKDKKVELTFPEATEIVAGVPADDDVMVTRSVDDVPFTFQLVTVVVVLEVKIKLCLPTQLRVEMVFGFELKVKVPVPPVVMVIVPKIFEPPAAPVVIDFAEAETFVQAIVRLEILAVTPEPPVLKTVPVPVRVKVPFPPLNVFVPAPFIEKVDMVGLLFPKSNVPPKVAMENAAQVGL